MAATKKHLSDAELWSFLEDLPNKDWSVQNGAFVRTFSFRSYLAGLDFAMRVGQAGEKENHHPDLQIGYKRVRVAWSTHDAKRMTQLDVTMAKKTNQIFAQRAASKLR